MKPIGLFDSGVGGLTVARALAERLPHRRLIYFGDTAHLPYGDKSPEAIQSYSRGIVDFLLSHDVEAIVVACNTATAVAIESLRAYIDPSVPLFNVIDPVVTEVARLHPQAVGVIGTRGTIASEIYPRRIAAAGVSTRVSTLATPLLVPIIEEGLAHSPILRTTLHHYLSQPELQNIEYLIPGCTHYPLLTEEIQAFYGPSVQLLDAPALVAQSVAEALEPNGNTNLPTTSDHRFFVSDYTPTFQHIARQFFGSEVALELVSL